MCSIAMNRVDSGCHSRLCDTLILSWNVDASEWNSPGWWIETRATRLHTMYSVLNLFACTVPLFHHVFLSLIFSSFSLVPCWFTQLPLHRELVIGDAGSRQFEPVYRRRCPASTSAPLTSPSLPPASKLLPKTNHRHQHYFHHPSTRMNPHPVHC